MPHFVQLVLGEGISTQMPGIGRCSLTIDSPPEIAGIILLPGMRGPFPGGPAQCFHLICHAAKLCFQSRNPPVRGARAGLNTRGSIQGSVVAPVRVKR